MSNIISKIYYIGIVIMRIIKHETITEQVKNMCTIANCKLGEDVLYALAKAEDEETSLLGKKVLSQLVCNADLAAKKMIPVCQDTGMAVFFVEIGAEVFVDGNIEKAISEGVSRGYTEGYLRASVVEDPLRRKNTGDNTPPIIHINFTDGDKIKITFAPKGFGSENMSAIKMLKPSDGYEGVVDFVVDTVKKAGSNPCPPIVVGVGIGGTMEKAAILSKKALTYDVGQKNDDKFYNNMQEELLQKINNLGIGPQGFGGKVTALGVNILTYPTHIAGLPVAVNINCHVARHLSIML